MNVTYRESAKQGDEGQMLLQQATQRLQEIIGPSTGQVSAEWEKSQDERGRTLYTLKIWDNTGEASASFAAKDLASPSELRYRLLDLWGDLLQIRSHKQLQQLLDTN